MLVSLTASLGLLAQVAALPVRTAAEPVRVWRADSTVYVALRDAGYVTLLHAGPDGRISVLFPLEPDLAAGVAAGIPPLRLALPPNAQGDPATFVAIRSRWPFDFAALRGGRDPPGITTMRGCCNPPPGIPSRHCSTSPTASRTGVRTITRQSRTWAKGSW